MNFPDCGLTATGTQEFGHDDHIRSCPSREGEQMIVDLESWEAGYDDGLLGRPSQCASGLDRFSDSSGYYQARACRAGAHEDPGPRHTRPSTQQARYGGNSRLIII